VAYKLSMTKPKIRKAVVTDAGYATRFLPVTKTLPKCMIPIMDKPITQLVIEECMIAGITEIILVATEEGKPIYEDYFHNSVQHIYNQLAKQGKESRFNKVREVFELPSIVVITQDKNLPYGNATPLISAKPYIGNEPFVHLFADDVILGPSSIKELIETYESSDESVAGVIAAQDIPTIDVTKYGMVKLKEGTGNILERLIEKPKKGEEPSTLVSFGRYLYTPHIWKYLSGFENLVGKDGELWAVDIIEDMAQEHTVLVKPISGQWKTTGDPVNYLKTVIDYAKQNEEFKKDLNECLN